MIDTGVSVETLFHKGVIATVAEQVGSVPVIVRQGMEHFRDRGWLDKLAEQHRGLVENQCEFCSTGPVVQRFEIHPFTTEFVGETVTISEPYAACAVCASFITQGNKGALVARALSENPPKPPLTEAIAAGLLVKKVDDFFVHRVI